MADADTATAPSRANGGARPARARRSATRAKADDLESQIHQLQTDISSITHTLSRMGELGVDEVKSRAKTQSRSLLHRGQSTVEQVTDEFGAIEKQIKDTIRERPLTAVFGAIAVGFVLAVVTR